MRKVTGKELPALSYLNSRLLHCEGLLYWRHKEGDDRSTNSWNAKHAGKVAGGYDFKGYVVVRLDGETFKAHRLIWAMHNNAELDPALDIDHIDNDSGNNHPNNLRAVTPEFNSQRKRNTWGMRGIKAAATSLRAEHE